MTNERQGSLFGDERGPGDRGPVWRMSDPSTSQVAAKAHKKSGRAGTHRATILAFVRENPDRTGAEIGEGTGLGQIASMRRLADLRHGGLVSQGGPRACRIKGSKMVTWKTSQVKGDQK